MKNYWFKNKKYGIGWVPSSIEGWVALIGCILTIILNLYFYSIKAYDTKITILIFIVALVVFIGVMLVTGEKLILKNFKSDTEQEST